jgi:hypothetical protein
MPDQLKPKRYSIPLTEGPNRAAARSFLRAAAIALFLRLPLHAQSAPVAIPIPATLTTAHTAFVANAGGPDNYLSQVAYKNLYQALTNWKHLLLVDTPSSAELALELTTAQHAGASFTTHLTVLQLNIRDIKTQSILWSFTEPVSSAATPMASDISAATSKLVNDFNALLTGSLLQESAPKKTRFSEEGKK